MFRLDHKNVLITGAGSGIGKAIAELFARVGASVWVVDRDTEAGAATGAGAGVGSAGLLQAAKAKVATREAISSDLFMCVLNRGVRTITGNCAGPPMKKTPR